MNLEEHGYVHKTVNHSESFINHETVYTAYTQNIESSWRWMRRELSRGGVRKDFLGDYLCEFLWRRRIKKLGQDPFMQLLLCN